MLAVLAACGGGSDSEGGGTTPPPAGQVAISGRITFDRVPVGTTSTADVGLNYAAIVQAPARGVLVEAISDAGAVLTSTSTDENGRYSLNVAQNTQVLIRAKAQMVRTGSPSWNFTVRDNVRANALYTLDGNAASSGAANSERNLRAPSGWNDSSKEYSAERAAAPFAVLDAVYQSVDLVLSTQPSASFPALDLFWSPENVPSVPGADGLPVPATGEIGSTFFLPTKLGTAEPGLYVLGEENSDTDEYDKHVIAHELGHYYQSRFSRDDSIGGAHDMGSKLDPRVAFSEGWANVYAAMAYRDPVYRDSFGNAQAGYFGFSVETTPSSISAPQFAGWFSEFSVHGILYDIYDNAVDGADSIELGFTPLHTMMTQDLKNTSAFTTIYPALKSLRDRNISQAAVIQQLANNQAISLGSNDDFGTSENSGGNNGGDASNLPLYAPVVTNGSLTNVVSKSISGGSYNTLGVNKYLVFDLTGASNNVTITAAAATAGRDADIVLYSKGTLVGQRGNGNGNETLSVGSLAAGKYVLEVYDAGNRDGSSRADSTIQVRVTAN